MSIADLAVDSEESMYVVGNRFGPDVVPDSVLFFAKFARSCNTVYTASFGGRDARGVGIAVTPSGSIVIVGHYVSRDLPLIGVNPLWRD